MDVNQSNLRRSTRILKKVKENKEGQPMFKKRAPNQDGSSDSMGKLKRGGGSQIVKFNCVTCKKKNVGKFLPNTGVLHGCLKMVIR